MTTSFFEDSHKTEPLDEQLVIISLSTYPGRIAARAYAYALIAEGQKEDGEAILDLVGREEDS